MLHALGLNPLVKTPSGRTISGADWVLKRYPGVRPEPVPLSVFDELPSRLMAGAKTA